MSEQQSHKAHRASQSGKKAEKKDVAQGKDKSGGHKGFNEKVSKPPGGYPPVHAILTCLNFVLGFHVVFIPVGQLASSESC
jgi:hypothetical protein